MGGRRSGQQGQVRARRSGQEVRRRRRSRCVAEARVAARAGGIRVGEGDGSLQGRQGHARQRRRCALRRHAVRRSVRKLARVAARARRVDAGFARQPQVRRRHGVQVARAGCAGPVRIVVERRDVERSCCDAAAEGGLAVARGAHPFGSLPSRRVRQGLAGRSAAGPAGLRAGSECGARRSEVAVAGAARVDDRGVAGARPEGPRRVHARASIVGRSRRRDERDRQVSRRDDVRRGDVARHGTASRTAPRAARQPLRRRSVREPAGHRAHRSRSARHGDRRAAALVGGRVPGRRSHRDPLCVGQPAVARPHAHARADAPLRRRAAAVPARVVCRRPCELDRRPLRQDGRDAVPRRPSRPRRVLLHLRRRLWRRSEAEEAARRDDRRVPRQLLCGLRPLCVLARPSAGPAAEVSRCARDVGEERARRREGCFGFLREDRVRRQGRPRRGLHGVLRGVARVPRGHRAVSRSGEQDRRAALGRAVWARARG